MEGFFVVCGLVFVGMIWMAVVSHNSQEDAKKAFIKSKGDYFNSLKNLKFTPTNADLKEKTLALGRAYSILSRSGAGVTTVDEISLMNDINAACAAATINPPLETTPLSTGASIETRLRTLTDLRDKELVDATEYEKRRCEILNGI